MGRPAFEDGTASVRSLTCALLLVAGCGPGPIWPGQTSGGSDSVGSTGSEGTASGDSVGGTTRPEPDPPPVCELVADADEFPLPIVDPACETYLSPRNLWTIPVRIHNSREEAVIVKYGRELPIEAAGGTLSYPVDCSQECTCEEWISTDSCWCNAGPAVLPSTARMDPGGVLHGIWRGYLRQSITLPDTCVEGLSCAKVVRAEPGPHLLRLRAGTKAACQDQTGETCECAPDANGVCSLGNPSWAPPEIAVPFELGEPCDGVDAYIE